MKIVKKSPFKFPRRYYPWGHNWNVILNYNQFLYHAFILFLVQMSTLGISSRLDQVFDAPDAVKEVLTSQFALEHSVWFLRFFVNVSLKNARKLSYWAVCRLQLKMLFQHARTRGGNPHDNLISKIIFCPYTWPTWSQFAVTQLFYIFNMEKEYSCKR